MKKIFVFLSALFIFSGCINFYGSVAFDEADFYAVNMDSGSLYFSYPRDAEINSSNGSGVMKYDVCTVGFGRVAPRIEEVDPEVKEADNYKYFAYFDEKSRMNLYTVENTKYDYSFWGKMGEVSVSSCTDLIDFMAYSLTDKPYFQSDKYGFSAPILDGFALTYLDDEQGILLTQRIENEEEDIDFGEIEVPLNYTVEIKASAFENKGEWADLGHYIADQYPGYNAEFATVDGKSGVFVDEESASSAVRNFFMISDDNSVIYRAYLEVPTMYYSTHQEFFDDNFALKIKIF